MAFEPVRKVISLLEGYPHPWCVCGGWALDLFLGRETREHEDVEILVYRRDQAALWQHFAYWSLVKIVPRPDDEPLITPWEQSEWLALPVHQIRSYAREDMPEFDLMLNEGDDDFWLYRRNTAIQRRRSQAHQRTIDGIPFLAPEVALLYKAHHRRAKDEQDFRQVYPRLDDEQRTWLIQSIAACYPAHPWLDGLQQP